MDNVKLYEIEHIDKEMENSILLAKWCSDKYLVDFDVPLSSGHVEIYCSCRRCGAEWKTTLSNIINGRAGCFFCERDCKETNPLKAILLHTGRMPKRGKNKKRDMTGPTVEKKRMMAIKAIIEGKQP